MKKKQLSLLLCIVMVLSLLPMSAFAAEHPQVDFLIQDYNNVHFLGNAWYERFQGQTVNADNTISHLPIVVRTDTDALVFDGWYTERTGGEKVTTDTVFNSYTILYDHWVDAPATTDTVIDSIKINNSSTTNGYTILDYDNASAVPTVTKSGATLVNAVRGGSDFSIFKGVASIEPAFTDNDRMNKNADYTVVTQILLNNGYRINKDTLFSAQNGIIFRKQFAGMVNGEPVSVNNEWFAGATSVKIFISLHGEATTPYFYVQPESGSAENGTPYKYSFEITSKPSHMVLQTKAGNDTWVDLCEVDYTSGVYQTPAYNDKTMTFRLVVTGWAIGGPSYTGPVQSNEFTVTWGENTTPTHSFVVQPTGGNIGNNKNFVYNWECDGTPDNAYLEMMNSSGSWIRLADDSKTTPPYSNISRTFRVAAVFGNNTYYSDEFTVTWTDDTTPPIFEFTTQPQSGTSKKTEAYSFTFALSSTPVGIILQVWDPSDEQWIYCCDLNEYSAAVAYNSNFCKDNVSKYRILTSDGNSYIYSDEFTVTWTDDTTPPVFEFTTQPQSGTSKKNETYSFTFALSSTPVGIILQVWDPSDEQWIYCCDLNEYSAAVAYNSNFCKDNVSKYRILTSDGNSYIYSDEFTVTWTDDTTPPAPLTELSATITAPVAGATPVWTATAGSSDYTAEVYWWYLYGSDGTFEKLLQNTDTFEAGKKYAAIVRFTPASGIEMSGDATATINGLSGKYGGFDPVTGALVYFVDFIVPEAPPVPVDPCEGYTDIDRSKWYHDAADFVIARGLMGSTKTDALTFEPNTKVSRAMVASILYRMAGSPAVEYKATFTDVPADKWFTNAIEWCAQNGLASGKGNGKFDPNGNVTRQELAVFMMKMAEYLGKDTFGRADLGSFADGTSVPSWAKEYVQWAVSAGLISGKANGGKTYLAPTDTATRAEFASIIMRFVQNIAEAK